ncbi:FimV/HubP family polar landmark protein [Variovorax sp. LT1R16]|uniref:FimV/HubP family polar landmark protein n=1 Tax=Variovorax sp. LT1R16 TaxID=3443728 RepID=UPI003F44FE57
MTRTPLLAARVLATRPPRRLPGRAPLSALGAAIALALGGAALDAQALSLGRITVQSALGEPLRAEIDVAEINASEAEGLRVNVGSPEAFRTAGVPYNAALSEVRSTLQRRADGRYVVRLSSNRSVSDPFIDLVIEASWGSGRITREYTVLLDPPSSRPPAAATAIAPTPAQIAPPAAPPLSVAPPARPRPATAAVAAPPPVPTAPSEPPTARAAAAVGGSSGQVTVHTGDTASKIAGAYKPAEVSLDQMLVALLRANPNAFIDGNVNRVRAGAVLDLPSAAQATATPAAEARRTVIAQSRDFGDYRRRLADNAPNAKVASADRQATGKLQANVQDRNAVAASPDKLTIAQARAADDKLAQARQAQESNARLAELSKNISELNKLQGAGAPAPAPAPATAGTTAAPSATAVAPAAAPATPATAPSAASGALPSVAASAALAAATVPPAGTVTPPAAAAAASAPRTPAPANAPPSETNFLDELLSNPLMLGGGALILLLLAFLAYRLTQSRRRDTGESVFLESRLPKDSFFAASGGESVDTKNRNSVVSSLSYSPSQLDTGDVDPVAEADVYLAYGRDLQAEEILREALRLNPERAAIPLKLLEIHAKRRDLRAYEALAADVHKLTGGTGSDWNRVVEMGKELDPGNPLYEAGVRPVAEAALPVAAIAVAAAAMTPPPPPATVPPPPAFVSSVAPLDFDLDLQTPDAYPTTMTAPITEQPAIQADLPHPPSPAPARFGQPPNPPSPALPSDHEAPGDFDTDFNTAPAALETPGLSFSLPVDEHTRPAPLRAEPKDDSGFIEFDMSALSGLNGRDSNETEPGRLEPLDDGADNPHAIKLSLARELQALGDTEGARSLVEEVEAESVGDLKTQARQLLAEWA